MKTEATIRFEKQFKQAQDLMDSISGALDNVKSQQRKNKDNWGYAGSMCYVVEQLTQIDTFLSNNN